MVTKAEKQGKLLPTEVSGHVHQTDQKGIFFLFIQGM